ncbi:MAG: hypothetical protein ACYC26_13620 [Phycisphaerales bacterium]
MIVLFSGGRQPPRLLRPYYNPRIFKSIGIIAMNISMRALLIANMLISVVFPIAMILTLAYDTRVLGDAVVFREAETARNGIHDQWAYDTDMPTADADWNEWDTQPIPLTLPRRQWLCMLDLPEHLTFRIDMANDAKTHAYALLAILCTLTLGSSLLMLRRSPPRQQPPGT